MKAPAFQLLLTAILSIAFSSVALPHHSTSAEFNLRQRVILSGTITKVSWTNPHSFFFVDAKDPVSGNIVTWACELGSPNMLATLGWNHNTLRVGMTVSLTGILARDGSHKVMARNIVADGNRIVAWPSEQNQP
jgi:hypothetical protein